MSKDDTSSADDFFGKGDERPCNTLMWNLIKMNDRLRRCPYSDATNYIVEFQLTKFCDSIIRNVKDDRVAMERALGAERLKRLRTVDDENIDVTHDDENMCRRVFNDRAVAQRRLLFRALPFSDKPYYYTCYNFERAKMAVKGWFGIKV